MSEIIKERTNWGEIIETFSHELPFKKHPFSKRNWGDQLHSLCSFSGKLKPSLAYHLIDRFTSEGDTILDCFSGSGTVPFEAALNGRMSYGFDINPVSLVVSRGKLGKPDMVECQSILQDLKSEIITSTPSKKVLDRAKDFGFNKTLKEYYHPDTLIEIVIARSFFKSFPLSQRSDSYYLILASLLHILHGNRPYALSRRSHPITPYAPTGEFEYKNLSAKLFNKVSKSLSTIKDDSFIPGIIFDQDITEEWPCEIQQLNSIITSPPFFESTKFYLNNWIRNWFLGWENEDFLEQKEKFVETKQRKSFEIYDRIFSQSKDRLAVNGNVLFHLGKSKKKNMGDELISIAKRYFESVHLVDEDVSMVEKHGVTDKGSVSVHQYLLCY